MIDLLTFAPLACSWCGHEPHQEACTRTIQTGSSKTPTTKPCPCRKHERRSK